MDPHEIPPEEAGFEDKDALNDVNSETDNINNLQDKIQESESAAEKKQLEQELADTRSQQIKKLCEAFKIEDASDDVIEMLNRDTAPTLAEIEAKPRLKALSDKLNKVKDTILKALGKAAAKFMETLDDIKNKSQPDESKTIRETRKTLGNRAAEFLFWALKAIGVGGLVFGALWLMANKQSGCYLIGNGVDKQVSDDGDCSGCPAGENKCATTMSCVGNSCDKSQECSCVKKSPFDVLGDMLTTVQKMIKSDGEGLASLIKYWWVILLILAVPIILKIIHMVTSR